MVRVGCSLILKAYYGRKFQSRSFTYRHYSPDLHCVGKRQIHVNEADLEPILDEQCEPWSQPLDGLPWVSKVESPKFLTSYSLRSIRLQRCRSVGRNQGRSG